MSVLVIAECGSSHDNDLDKAKRLIDAAKECGADVAKFQWTSNALTMAYRRGLDLNAAAGYRLFLEKPPEWLYDLHEHCEKVGIEFACTVYLQDDIEVIKPLVQRYKVSAFESQQKDFILAHEGKPIVLSLNPGKSFPHGLIFRDSTQMIYGLHCISKYPTPVDELNLWNIGDERCGLSDHTFSAFTGGWAVASGAILIEKHIRLESTRRDNPDWAHSLDADVKNGVIPWANFGFYVAMIREAEKAL